VSGTATEHQNPFSLRHALGFGAVYMAVLLAVHLGRSRLGARGLYLTAAVSGLADVDAITVAIARGGPTDGGWSAPVLAITIAAIANSLVKAGLAVALGAGSFRVLTAAALAAMALAGGVTAFVLRP